MSEKKTKDFEKRREEFVKELAELKQKHKIELTIVEVKNPELRIIDANTLKQK